MKRTSLLISRTMLLLNLGWGMALYAAPKIHTIKTEAPMHSDLFGMQDEDYFRSPDKNFSAVGRKLVEEGFDGLILGGPSFIPLDKELEFPIVALSVAESMQSSRYLFAEFCLATALNLQSGEIYAEYFVEPRFVRSDSKRYEALAKHPPPPGLTPDGNGTDLFERLNIPRRPGEYLVTVVLLGKASNRIRVKVGFSDAEHDQAKVNPASQRARYGEPGPPPELHETKVLSQIKITGSPPLPPENGIALRAEVLTGPKNASPEIMIFGSYRLAHPKRNPNGTVSIILLGTGTQVVLPVLEKVILKPANALPSEGDKAVTGFFSLKLDKDNGLRGNQTYFFYALSEQALSAPSKVELVSSMKPKPE